uniref:OST-HTH/LOTUS domain-containing protein n=1 Tax=Ornithinimicrobium sp. CNJ-824 TaxID=1904966 RepID=UPI003158ECE9
MDDAGDGGDRREPDAPGDEDRESRTPSINLQSALTKGVNATSDDDGWSRLSVVGQHLNRAHADFDPREFGYAKLSQLVQDQPYLETTTEGSHLMVRLRQKRSGRTTRTTDRAAAAKDAEKSPAKGTAAKGPAKTAAKTAAKTTAKATAKTPAQATSRSRSRAGTSASKESPANESPAQETPAKESAAQDAPAQESSVEEPAAQETPTRRTATRRTAGRRATSATTSPAGGDA